MVLDSSRVMMADTNDTNDTKDAQRMKKCIAMLQGPSDEHVFAGLYMITKLDTLSIDQRCDFQRRISKVLGRDFIPRLLESKEHDEVAKGLDQIESLRSLAYNILSSFTADPNLAVDYAQERLVLRLCTDMSNSPATGMASDCIAVLNNFLPIKCGQELLLRESVSTRLFDTVRIISGELHEKRITGEDKEKRMAIVNDLWCILAHLSTYEVFWSRMHAKYFGFICSEFANKYSKAENLQIVKIITQCTKWLDHCDNKREGFLVTENISNLRRGLEHILRQKWPRQERDHAWNCMYGLLKYVDCTEMFTIEKAHGSKFLLLLLKLVAVEIKLSLDEAEDKIIRPDHSAVIDVSELKRREEGVDRILQVLPTCYGIVEVIISWLANSSSEIELLVPCEALLQIQQTLTELSRIVATMLCLTRDFMKSHLYSALELHNTQFADAVHTITYASIRFYGAWIAESLEDSEALIYKHNMLPFLICYKSNSIKDVNDHLEELEIRAVNDCDSKIMQNSMTLDPLHFLLPGILQITANVKAAHVIMDDSKVLRRLFAFTCEVCRRIDAAYESAPTLTLCLGIFINILMLNRQRDVSTIQYASEWIHALKFIVPMTCASGTFLTGNEKSWQQLDQYELILHLVCTSLLIGTMFLWNQDAMEYDLLSQVNAFIKPFNNIVQDLKAHPPSSNDDSVKDLYEIFECLSSEFSFKSNHATNTQKCVDSILGPNMSDMEMITVFTKV
uniref:Uncharacterized protein AlNc14C7G937 n=1 Tax=Albugo laibachii Nc14 TaxID=890382 RepID=F0W1G9_9STRA|nr:conserved hypothetical protein [Albugo laibachii Nc14]|eukprot:CCA14898.1 conserved hypothetical protein [Albugo laibachii Nc14]